MTGLLLLAVKASGSQAVDFQRDIAPLLERHCIRCHTPDSEDNDVSLATIDDLTSGGYVRPGEPAASKLLELVSASSANQRPAMPAEGEPLSPREVEALRQWIADGAEWPPAVVLRERSGARRSWWSLRRLGDYVPPSIEGAPRAWQGHPIDRFLYAQLSKKGLRPSPRADGRTLIRRATYDLIGLPPTPEEVRTFLQDTSPDAWERLIDRLLQSPHYGERWGRHWMDVIRFGESRGFERNEIINNAWPFRDYVIHSFNEDKPFDQLVREHLAGDVIGNGDPNKEVATAFLVCGPYDDVGNQDPKQAAQIRANTIDEIIRATSEAFLGLTVGCARCHDHKFDPVTQRDYYALYATFAGVYHGERVVATPEQKHARRTRLKPWAESRDRLQREIDDLENATLERAQRRASEWEKRWTRPRVKRTGTVERFAPVRAKFVRLVVERAEANPRSRTGFGVDEFEVWTSDRPSRNVALAANGGRARGASRVANDFSDAYSAKLTNDGDFGARWIAAGPELLVELARTEVVDRVVMSSDRNGDAGDHPVAAFVCEYRVEVSLDGKQFTEVANSHDRQPSNEAHRHARLIDAEISAQQRQRLTELRQQLSEVTDRINSEPPLPVWWVGNFKPTGETFHIFLGGDPSKRGPRVTPASLSALEGVASAYRLPHESDEGQRRLALAEWLVHDDNPLPPRVLANRLWCYHFGTGIVETPSDFGFMGGQPSHPELLDWLATQVRASGWRLKPLHKLIMLSETYRQASLYRKGPAEVDTDSRYLWRFPPRRLSAEEIRDTMLQVAGMLDTTMGGPGFRLYRYLQDNVATYVPLDEHGPLTWRRAVYHQNARASRTDVLSDFDCPDPAFAAPRRASTVTPLQALTLLNHRFSLDTATFFARRLQRESAADDPGAQVHRAFQLAYSRNASRVELDAAIGLIEQHGLRAFCRALLNTNELIYIE